MSLDDRIAGTDALLKAIKQNLPELQELLDGIMRHAYDDAVYRFYHTSFKVYWFQQTTTKMVAALRALAPDQPLNSMFQQILTDGTGHEFEPDHNGRWLQVTRPIVEAFLHAKFFLEMACKYGRELDTPPNVMESGWAALLYFYNLR